MNNPLEHNVYKPVKISHLSCLVLFVNYFCGSAGFSTLIYTHKNTRHFNFQCYFTKINGFPHRMLCISNLAFPGLYLLQFNVASNLFNFSL